jgi:hypothetical protein
MKRPHLFASGKSNRRPFSYLRAARAKVHVPAALEDAPLGIS